MPWVPHKDRDARWYIWNKRFDCRLPNIQTYSIDHIKIFGMPTSGYEDLDKEMANEIVERSLTIIEMIKFFHEGASIRIKNVKDTKVIYDYISEHLNAWKHEIETAYSINHVPVEELLIMDKFAQAVYEHAKWHFPKDYQDSMLSRFLQKSGRIPKSRVLPRAPEVQVVNSAPLLPHEQSEEDEGPTRPERASMASVFTSRGMPAKPNPNAVIPQPVVVNKQSPTRRFSSLDWKHKNGN